jgi:hypothetical protein
MSARSLKLPSHPFPRRMANKVVDRVASRALSQSALQQETILSGIGLLHEDLRTGDPRRLADCEFKVFSQFGEDGILAWLTRNFAPEDRTFVEIGVGSYSEANTRYLASRARSPWRGCIIDCEGDHLDFGGHPESWRWDVRPIQALVRPDNVDEVLRASGFTGDIGLFSLDIDGVDYWVWDAISSIKPRIVVTEVNSVFGPNASVTVPFAQEFDMRLAHHSRLYFGASLSAMVTLSESRGYTFVGATSTGVNAFFVRNDLLRQVWPTFAGTSVADEWSDGGLGNARDEAGNLLRLALTQKQAAISQCAVFDTRTKTVRRACDAL